MRLLVCLSVVCLLVWLINCLRVFDVLFAALRDYLFGCLFVSVCSDVNLFVSVCLLARLLDCVLA